MNILVLCPMREEKENFLSSLKKFTRFNIFRHNLKIVTCGIGKVNAATEAVVWCNSSNYDLVCVVGYAAATTDYTVGELVAPSAAKYSDVKIPEELDVPELTTEYPLQGCECKIYTADSFVDANMATDILNRQQEKSALFDMESAAVCQAVQDYKIPVLVLKIVSDIPQKDKDKTSFSHNVEVLKDFIPIVSYINMLEDV